MHLVATHSTVLVDPDYLTVSQPLALPLPALGSSDAPIPSLPLLLYSIQQPSRSGSNTLQSTVRAGLLPVHRRAQRRASQAGQEQHMSRLDSCESVGWGTTLVRSIMCIGHRPTAAAQAGRTHFLHENVWLA